MKYRLLTVMMMLTVCFQVSSANVKWKSVEDKLATTKFSALKTYNGEVIKKIAIKGYEDTVAEIMERGQVETRLGQIVYAREIGSFTIPINTRRNPFGKKPATEE